MKRPPSVDILVHEAEVESVVRRACAQDNYARLHTALICCEAWTYKYPIGPENLMAWLDADKPMKREPRLRLRGLVDRIQITYETENHPYGTAFSTTGSYIPHLLASVLRRLMVEVEREL